MKGKTGLEDYYVIRNNKKMRFGYTTGSCATAAAMGAAEMLLGNRELSEISFMTPAGILLTLPLLQIQREKGQVSCAVKKDAGDDPDVTDGILIYSCVELTEEEGIFLEGGKGVGRVTKLGLDQPVGASAINSVPRKMILQALESVVEKYAYSGGLRVTVSVPEGENIAQKTFNPRLGIQGGISILGTSGIVEPMSERALTESIGIEIRQQLAEGREYLLVTPGNYGQEYLRNHMDLSIEKSVKCSNFVGETIDMAVDFGAKGILFVAHIGKFVKVGAGIMNTHSHNADARMETLAACAVRAGADLDCVRAVLDCNTTEEALFVLKERGILEASMEILMQKIQFYLDAHSYNRLLLGAVVFSSTQGYLGETANAAELMNRMYKNYR